MASVQSIENVHNSKEGDKALPLFEYFATKVVDGKSTQVASKELPALSDSGSLSEDSVEAPRSPRQLTPELLAVDRSSFSTDNGSPYSSGAVTPAVLEIINQELAGTRFDISNNTTKPEVDENDIVIQILRIIEQYGVNFEKPNSSWGGLTSFIPIVAKQVADKEPVRMILPAFPFKSPNSVQKTVGVMPDLGEELALAHLHGLCENIKAKYEHGAEVHICSDGLVYNDLLGVPNDRVWDYGEKLRQMAVDKDCTNVKFIRLWDLLGHPGPQSDDPYYCKEYYLEHASCFRREMIYRFGEKNFDAAKAIQQNQDICITYRGYIKFLTKDLAANESYKKLSKGGKATEIARVAKAMITRGKCFANAIKEHHSHYVRLSIHDSVGEGKLSMSLIPQIRGVIAPTPWHSSIAVNLDGTYTTVHAEDVKMTHDLVYKNGVPYYFREKGDVWDWSSNELTVVYEFLYPQGLIIRPGDVNDSRGPPSILKIPMKKVRQLAITFSPVVLRGFADSTVEEHYVTQAYELGNVLPWTFGIMQKVKDAGRTDKLGNNVTSNEAMPMHFDGMFKFVDHTDPVTGEISKVQTPPGFQFFTCQATAPKGSGYTLYASSRLFFRYLPQPWSIEKLENAQWGMDNDGFWDAKMKDLKLVVRHPVNNLPCLRWHEPWGKDKTKFSTCAVFMENEDQALVDIVNHGVYDHRVCLRFSWETGDLLIADNTAMLHTRTGYKTNCDRELWRIHFD